MEETAYQPVSCADHSAWELAIMHRTPLTLRWHSGSGETLVMTLQPLDLRAERGVGEFLIARDEAGQEHRIRLDRIIDTANGALS